MTEEITDIIKPEAIEKLNKNQILTFMRANGQRIDLKITKIDKKNHRIWAKRTLTFPAEDISIVNQSEFDDLNNNKIEMETVSEHLERNQNGTAQN